jgi:hypothetical protein
MTGARRVGVLVASSALACACSAILGIEDLKSGSPPDAGSGDAASGAGGSSGGGGGLSGSGGSPMGGGGSSGAGGSAGGSAGGAGGGASGASGASAGGSGGSLGNPDAGPDGSAPSPVQGTVIDFWGHKLAGVPVTIGATTVQTDQNGVFTIPGVEGSYDVSLVVTTTINGGAANLGWMWKGLTRKDPTLQVYRGLPPRSGEVLLHVSGASFPLTSTQTIGWSFAGADGEFADTLDSKDTDYLSAVWSGNPSTQGVVHALFWTFSGTQSLPTKYLATDSGTLALNETAAGSISFDLTPGTVPLDTISGKVTTSLTTDRENDIYVRWQDGAAIEVVQDGNPQSTYSYSVPTINGAGITVAASTGSSGFPPYAVAYRDDVAPGQTNVDLTIPTAAVPVSPVTGATGVGASTTFHWSGGGKVSLFTVAFSATYDTMFVVTADKQEGLPSFPASGFTIPASTDCEWYVESHGAFATVDDATGPGGMLDAFSNGTPRGPKRGTSSYTESEHRTFTTAP